MICGNYKSTEFDEGKIKLKSGEFQTLIYCSSCGNIMDKLAAKKAPRKSWAERKAAATKRHEVKEESQSLTWAQRKARKGLTVPQEPTVPREPPSSNQTKSQPSDDGSVPF